MLHGATDLRALLVGNVACENPGMPLVDPRGGATALDNSWPWMKLNAPTDASGNLAPSSAWLEPNACGQIPSTPYGVRMPNGTRDRLGSDRLEPIRAWICGGAPGP